MRALFYVHNLNIQTQTSGFIKFQLILQERVRQKVKRQKKKENRNF